MNTSAIDRLRALPPVFRGKQAILMFSWEPQRAAQYLYRWKDAGFVKPLGGKSDVYFNLIRDADVESTMSEAAVLMAMPSAVVRGHQVLAESGVSTQLCRSQQLGVAPDDSVFAITNTDIVRFSPRWLARLVEEGGIVGGERATRSREIQLGPTLPRLTPGAAIADLLVTEPASAAHPDDLDLNMLAPADRVRLSRLAELDATLPLDIALRKAFDALRSEPAKQKSACSGATRSRP